MKVLVADDQLIARKVVTSLLQKWGFEVVSVMDGKEAWRVMQSEDAPSLAVLDWMMPGLQGPAVCRMVRNLKRRIPPYLILLTSKDNKTDIVEGLDAGADDYMIKPFDASELKARIEVGKRFLELQSTLARRVEELQNALNHVKTLKGLLPICANCKKIRNDQGYWEQIEQYVREHSDAAFTHGICPECLEKLYPEEFKNM